MNRHVASLLTSLLLLTAAATATAQEFAEPSKAQYELYESGVEAFRTEQWERAIERFEASLRIGEMNLTYLNLGRAYFKAGDCAKAVQAYDKVATAPQLREPSPAQVLDKLDEYRTDLGTCPGTLVVRCDQPEAIISIEGQSAALSCNKPTSIAPGAYNLVGRVGKEEVRAQAEVKAMQESAVAMTFSGVAAPITPPPPSNDGLKVAGWVTAGIGLASLAASGAIFAINSGDATRLDELNNAGLVCPDDPRCAEQDSLSTSLDSANIQIAITAGVGVAALITGGVLLYLGYDEPAPEGGSSLLLAPNLIGVQGRF